MIPYILAAVGGYLIGDSLKEKQFAKGGKMDDDTMADGGMVEQNQKVLFKISYVIGVDKALKYLDKDYAVSPFALIQSAVRKGFITIYEIDENLWDAAVEEAEDIDETYRDSEEGIGSSDMNAFISRMLNAAGIKIGVIDNKYQRI